MPQPIRFNYLGEDKSPPCMITTTVAMPKSVFIRTCAGFLRMQKGRLLDESGDRRVELLRVIAHLQAAIQGEDGRVGQRVVSARGDGRGDLVGFDAPKMAADDRTPMIVVPENYGFEFSPKGVV